MSDAVLATITPTATRRVVAIALIAALGLLLIALAVFELQHSIVRQVFLLGLGAVFLALADKLRRATGLSLELTPECLRDSTGRVLVRMEDVASIERGTFAFKPTNGFALRLAQPGPRGWAPGLWWRMGRSLGVGGMVSKAEGRFMADAITAVLNARD